VTLRIAAFSGRGVGEQASNMRFFGGGPKNGKKRQNGSRRRKFTFFFFPKKHQIEQIYPESLFFSRCKIPPKNIFIKGPPRASKIGFSGPRGFWGGPDPGPGPGPGPGRGRAGAGPGPGRGRAGAGPGASRDLKIGVLSISGFGPPQSSRGARSVILCNFRYPGT